MSPAVLADGVLVVHGLFIVWAAFGALAVWRWPRLLVLHLPALAWGVWIEVSGGICPLTPLENSLRRAAGQSGYSGGFIDHYLGGLIYPAGLTREAQWAVAGVLLAINAVLYGLMIVRRRRSRRSPPRA
ncbi:MAG: DUF2784 domain-containing protein [Mycobacterium sp.]|nr:DUF2784 domain-containing protein [Mycobacterium sp.]